MNFISTAGDSCLIFTFTVGNSSTLQKENCWVLLRWEWGEELKFLLFVPNCAVHVHSFRSDLLLVSLESWWRLDDSDNNWNQTNHGVLEYVNLGIFKLNLGSSMSKSYYNMMMILVVFNVRYSWFFTRDQNVGHIKLDFPNFNSTTVLATLISKFVFIWKLFGEKLMKFSIFIFKFPSISQRQRVISPIKNHKLIYNWNYFRKSHDSRRWFPSISTPLDVLLG